MTEAIRKRAYILIALVVTANALFAQVTRETMQNLAGAIRDGRMPYSDFVNHRLIEDTDTTGAIDYYLNLQLARYTVGLNMRAQVEVDKPEQVLKNHVMDSLLHIVYMLGTKPIQSAWVSKQYEADFYSYYQLQKEIYSPIKEVTIQNIYCADPHKKKLRYPALFEIKAEIQTVKEKGEARFLYYQLSQDSFSFFRYEFLPYDYENVNQVDSAAAPFFKAIASKNSGKLAEQFTPAFLKRVKNRDKLTAYLNDLNVSKRQQLTSRIKYEQAGPVLLAYYVLSEENKYLILALKKAGNKLLVDDFSVLDKQTE